MSTSSSEVTKQEWGGCSRSRFPNWVDCLLGKNFFEKCERHDDMQKNEMNRYCISCNQSICRYCTLTTHHRHHNILTIYRHVYQNVVPLVEMENHINCQHIQPYKCNKKWVVSLTPLPHNGSGFLIEGNGACYVCKRKLTDHDKFRFCSVVCKVEWDWGRRVIKYIGKEEEDDEVEEAVVGRSRKRSRKGVPRRAPST